MWITGQVVHNILSSLSSYLHAWNADELGVLAVVVAVPGSL